MTKERPSAQQNNHALPLCVRTATPPVCEQGTSGAQTATPSLRSMGGGAGERNSEEGVNGKGTFGAEKGAEGPVPGLRLRAEGRGQKADKGGGKPAASSLPHLPS